MVVHDGMEALAVPGDTDAKTSEHTALIKQTEEEVLLAELERTRLARLSAIKEGRLRAKKEKKELVLKRRMEERFAALFESFFVLAEDMFTLTPREIGERSDRDILLMAGIVLKRSRRTRQVQQAFTFFVPVVGWLGGGFWYALAFDARPPYRGFKSWAYAKLYQEFSCVYGQDNFPEKLRKHLKQKTR